MWKRLRQYLCRHRYHPSYEMQRIREAGHNWTQAKHTFQYHCCYCGKPTGWIPRSQQEAWETKHNPDWRY